MTPALTRLRESIATFHSCRAEAELAWWRRGAVEAPYRAIADMLTSERGEELFGEALSDGGLPPEQSAALKRQRAFIETELAALELRPRLHALATTRVACGSEALTPAALVERVLVASGEAQASLAADALGRALDAAASELSQRRAACPSAFDEDTSRRARELGRALLAATDDAARELVAFATRPFSTRGRAPLAALLAGLRASTLDGSSPAPRRYERLAAPLRRLGLGRELDARVRVEPSTHAIFPFVPAIATRGVPHDVRITTTPGPLGVLTDVDASAAIGCGLAHALASHELPVELRFASGQGAAESVGFLFSRLRASRVLLRRVEGLSARDADPAARHAALLVLLGIRASAALELAAAEPVRHDAERREQLRVALARALTLDVPEGLAVLAWCCLPADAVDLRARCTGLAAHLALRERFDEDWFDNPRSAEPLRGVCMRGPTLDAATVCTELGTTPDAAVPALLELLA